MLVGLAIFVIGRKHLPPDVRPAAVARGPRASKLSPDDWRAIGTLCLITLLLTFFWAGYEQTGNAVVLWVRDFTDRSFFGWFNLRITWFQSIGPLLVFTLTPAILWLWGSQAARNREPDMITKLAIGCFLAAAAYGVLTLAAAQSGGGKLAAWEWTVLFFVLLTLGELYVSPVALSLYSTARARARGLADDGPVVHVRHGRQLPRRAPRLVLGTHDTAGVLDECGLRATRGRLRAPGAAHAVEPVSTAE